MPTLTPTIEAPSRPPVLEQCEQPEARSEASAGGERSEHDQAIEAAVREITWDCDRAGLLPVDRREEILRAAGLSD